MSGLVNMPQTVVKIIMKMEEGCHSAPYSVSIVQYAKEAEGVLLTIGEVKILIFTSSPGSVYNAAVLNPSTTLAT